MGSLSSSCGRRGFASQALVIADHDGKALGGGSLSAVTAAKKFGDVSF